MSRRIIRGSIVDQRTGLSPSIRYELEEKGEFPARRRISARAVGYYEDEVDEWIETRPRVKDLPPESCPTFFC